ncbi:hypothetical protein, partial [Gordonia sp. i37]|uniref:hypothetical protein n=1 Tax=Gordonia sp. i37 TaxID=1961707 RepID=UPI001C0BC86D
RPPPPINSNAALRANWSAANPDGAAGPEKAPRRIGHELGCGCGVGASDLHAASALVQVA